MKGETDSRSVDLKTQQAEKIAIYSGQWVKPRARDAWTDSEGRHETGAAIRVPARGQARTTAASASCLPPLL